MWMSLRKVYVADIELLGSFVNAENTPYVKTILSKRAGLVEAYEL